MVIHGRRQIAAQKNPGAQRRRTGTSGRSSVSDLRAPSPFAPRDYRAARSVYKSIGAPRRCVMCFFQGVIDELVRDGARQIFTPGNRRPESIRFTSSISADGGSPSCHPRVGAPVLRRDPRADDRARLARIRRMWRRGKCSIPISRSATSCVPSAANSRSGRLVSLPAAFARGRARIRARWPRSKRRSERDGIDYIVAKTWTTDAIFRETRARMKRRASAKDALRSRWKRRRSSRSRSSAASSSGRCSTAATI